GADNINKFTLIDIDIDSIQCRNAVRVFFIYIFHKNHLMYHLYHFCYRTLLSTTSYLCILETASKMHFLIIITSFSTLFAPKIITFVFQKVGSNGIMYCFWNNERK